MPQKKFVSCSLPHPTTLALSEELKFFTHLFGFNFPQTVQASPASEEKLRTLAGSRFVVEFISDAEVNARLVFCYIMTKFYFNLHSTNSL